MSGLDPKAWDKAKRLATAGDLDGAIEVLVAAGGHFEAGKLLASAGRYAEAADVLLDGVGVPTSQMRTLPAGPKREAALLAADYLSRAGMGRAATEIRSQLEPAAAPRPAGSAPRTSLPAMPVFVPLPADDDDDDEKTQRAVLSPRGFDDPSAARTVMNRAAFEPSGPAVPVAVPGRRIPDAPMPPPRRTSELPAVPSAAPAAARKVEPVAPPRPRAPQPPNDTAPTGMQAPRVTPPPPPVTPAAERRSEPPRRSTPDVVPARKPSGETPPPAPRAAPPKVATPASIPARRQGSSDRIAVSATTGEVTRPPSGPGVPVEDSTVRERAAVDFSSLDGLDDVDPFVLGAIVAGRYKLGPQIGQGGMAKVFRATDTEFDQPIAIKVFERMEDPTLLARFKQEALLSRQLSHPNIIRLFDIGTWLDRKYLTMELLIGGDLKERLTKPIALSESLDLLIQACRGLHAAHMSGIIHRDIKPQNLFITETKQLKVMDFGVAKMKEAARLTSNGVSVGTPEFMAPEQIRDSSTVTHAADQYAIGVTAYRMCTGRVPFLDKDLVSLLKKQLFEAPPAPRSVNPRLPPALDAIILKLLEKEPTARFASAAEVAEAFQSVRSRIGAPPAPVAR